MKDPVDKPLASDKIMRFSSTKLLSAALMSGVLMIIVGAADLSSGGDHGRPTRHRAPSALDNAAAP